MEKIKEKFDSQGNIIEVVLVKDNQEEKIPVDLLYKYGYFFEFGTGYIIKVDKVDELKSKCLDDDVIIG